LPTLIRCHLLDAHHLSLGRIDTPNASKSLSFRNQSLEDSSNLPDPDIIAQEIDWQLPTRRRKNGEQDVRGSIEAANGT
jgi:hypothetical protein